MVDHELDAIRRQAKVSSAGNIKDELARIFGGASSSEINAGHDTDSSSPSAPTPPPPPPPLPKIIASPRPPPPLLTSSMSAQRALAKADHFSSKSSTSPPAQHVLSNSSPGALERWMQHIVDKVDIISASLSPHTVSSAGAVFKDDTQQRPMHESLSCQTSDRRQRRCLKAKTSSARITTVSNPPIRHAPQASHSSSSAIHNMLPIELERKLVKERIH